ncbi:MAG TPA: type II toxin-antitoxin system VapB family antitoxin [Terriglobia bacterium]|nr:type II toxin-antitoxin system VapB family antitoxin [Terriglobia bacterium]
MSKIRRLIVSLRPLPSHRRDHDSCRQEALRERYERLQARRGKASVEELLAIAKRASAQAKRPYLDHAEFLYDERDLPK